MVLVPIFFLFVQAALTGEKLERALKNRDIEAVRNALAADISLNDLIINRFDSGQYNYGLDVRTARLSRTTPLIYAVENNMSKIAKLL